ncbi:MAG: DUF882 domain-containing protein [Rhizobiaceae bacterium]|nr:DUF882 domain-containing protein [Hyphomicrobiales bacterium]NRB29110.1 DUF882 domain-containing protein [Rhizobiaceae bacterium]
MKPASFQDTCCKHSPSVVAAHRGVFLLALFVLCLGYDAATTAFAETRTLKMYFTHTRESATITFKKNGKYLPAGLKKANRFLRDWRRKEPTKMDPALLDLVWEVYQKSGSRQPINVISAYRSPRTNNMLRRRGRGVAKTSQHTKGKALDFFLPDVSVAKLRALGLQAHRGGVGYYAGSFVHLDTGSVRHWPRMSSRQLKKVFPDGKTIHIPSNGKPLKGYKIARANLRKGLNADGSSRKTSVRRTLLATLFNNSNDNSDQNEGATPSRRPVLDKPVQAAALPRRQRPATGPDPFSLENRAAASQSPVPQGRVAVPSLRPTLPRPAPDTINDNAIVVAAAEPTDTPEATLQPVSTELALAAPEALPNVLRPAADIPDAGAPASNASLTPVADTGTQVALGDLSPGRSAPTPRAPITDVAAAPQSTEQLEVEQLKSRIETALARGRVATPAETAAEQQSNSQLAEALKSIPVPKTPNERPAETQLALAALPEPTLRNSALTTTSELNEPQPVVDQSRFAALDASEASTPSLRQELRPELIAASADRLKVPLPSSNPEREAAVATAANSAPSSDADPSYDLSLGDLDGSSVKKWAVSLSTRVGPSAVLTAPNYQESTRQEAPNRVYSAGFAQARFTLKSDSFSGKALTRVAFASFNTN